MAPIDHDLLDQAVAAFRANAARRPFNPDSDSWPTEPWPGDEDRRTGIEHVLFFAASPVGAV